MLLEADHFHGKLTYCLCALQAFAEPSHQTGPAEAAANDQEAVSRPFEDAAQHAPDAQPSGNIEQGQTSGAIGSTHQQAVDSNAEGMGSRADAAINNAQQNGVQRTAEGSAADHEPQGAENHFDLSGPQFPDDDDPANPDGKLMSLLMG